jgi:hypothetical protein
MDPGSLAGAAVSLLVPYLERVGNRAAEELADDLSEDAVPALKRLFGLVRDRVSGDKYAANQLTGLEERPRREGRQQALTNALTETLKDDSAFASELELLVSEAHARLGVNVTVSQVEGPVAVRGSVHQQGRNVAGHDLLLGS